MKMLPRVMMLLAMVTPAMAQADAAGRFFDDRLGEFKVYLDARANAATNAQERREVEAERKAIKRRIESARMGYTGLSPEEQQYWDSLRMELEAVLNLWAKSTAPDEGEKKATRAAAMAALAAAQHAYEAQMRFALAQLGMAACILDADTIRECTDLFRQELQREYRQDFQAVMFAVPWGLEEEADEEGDEKEEPLSHSAGEAEEGNVDLHGGEEVGLLDAPATPLMVQELAHEVTHNEATRAESAQRAAGLWRGYLMLSSQQLELCFGSERGASLVSGVPLPGAVEMSYYAAVQDRSKQFFLEAEQAWSAYVSAVVAAYDPCWKASEGALAHTPVAAEALLMQFPLFSTHEQYLAFILSPHLHYVDPEPMPDTGIVE